MSTRSAVIWSYVLMVGRFATAGIVTVVVAAYLSPEQYGIVALAMVGVGLAQSLALHGPAQSIIQRGEVTARHLDAAFWSTLIGSAFLTAIFAGAAPWWASVNGSAELVYVSWALAPAIMLNALVVVPDAILRRQLRFRSLSRRVLLASVLSGALAIAAAALGAGAWALVLQQLTQAAFSACAVWVAVRWRPKYFRVWAEFRDLRAFAAHSIVGLIAFFVASRYDAILLGAVFGPAVIGLYRFAVRITEMVSDVAVGGLSQVSLPHLSRSLSDSSTFVHDLSRMFHIGALTSFPLFGILIPTAPWLLGFISPNWVDAAPALQALCVSGAISAIGQIFASALQAAGRPGTVAWTAWLMAGLSAGTAVAIGVVAGSASQGNQALTIAAGTCLVNLIIVGIVSVITFSRVVRASFARTFRPAVPAVLAAAVAVAAGLAIHPVLRGASPLGGLTATGLVASAGAAAVMLVGDDIVGRTVRKIFRGFRSAAPGRTRRTSSAGADESAERLVPTVADQPEF